ncbi:TolC family protein [soil metagenome]
MRVSEAFRRSKIAVVLALLGWSTAARADDAAIMDAYVAEVLARNPSLHAEALRRDAFIAEAKGVTWSDPLVSVMVDRLPDSRPLMPMLRYQVTQTIPWPGKIGFTQDAIERRGEGAGAELDIRRLDLRLDAERAYLTLWLNAGRRETNRSIRALVATVANTALGKYSAGGGSHHEVVRAQVETSALDVEYLNLEGERGSILAMINALRLQPADDGIADPTDVAPPPAPSDVASLSARALANRPEVKRLKAQQAEWTAMGGLARRAPYPDVMGSVWLNQMLGDAPPTVGAMIGITLPVFSASSSAWRGIAFDDRAASVGEGLEDLKSMIRAQVADAVIAAQTAQRVVELIETVVLPKAHESFSASLGAYGSGLADMVTVLDAARALQKFELDLVEAKVRRGVALARLERAIGGRL